MLVVLPFRHSVLICGTAVYHVSRFAWELLHIMLVVLLVNHLCCIEFHCICICKQHILKFPYAGIHELGGRTRRLT